MQIVYGYMSGEPVKEMKLAVEKVRDALFCALDETQSERVRMAQVRKAYGEMRVLEERIKSAKRIHLDGGMR